MSLSERDVALVQAYSEAYKAAGGEWLPETEEEVLEILEDHGAETVRQAEVVARGQAIVDRETDGAQ